MAVAMPPPNSASRPADAACRGRMMSTDELRRLTRRIVASDGCLSASASAPVDCMEMNDGVVINSGAVTGHIWHGRSGTACCNDWAMRSTSDGASDTGDTGFMAWRVEGQPASSPPGVTGGRAAAQDCRRSGELLNTETCDPASGSSCPAMHPQA